MEWKSRHIAAPSTRHTLRMSEITQKSCLIEQAAKWVVLLSARDVSVEQRMEFESWLEQDPRHREVYEQAECLCHLLPPPKSLTTVEGANRYKWAKVLAGFLLFLAAGYFYIGQPFW
jgi:ferric-dicitrate binding protein FerR (iron transport regulator)